MEELMDLNTKSMLLANTRTDGAERVALDRLLSKQAPDQVIAHFEALIHEYAHGEKPLETDEANVLLCLDDLDAAFQWKATTEVGALPAGSPVDDKGQIIRAVRTARLDALERIFQDFQHHRFFDAKLRIFKAFLAEWRMRDTPLSRKAFEFCDDIIRTLFEDEPRKQRPLSSLTREKEDLFTKAIVDHVNMEMSRIELVYAWAERPDMSRFTRRYFLARAAKLVPDAQALRVLEALREALPTTDKELSDGLRALRKDLETGLRGDESPFSCSVNLSPNRHDDEIMIYITAQEPESVLGELLAFTKRIVEAWPGEGKHRWIKVQFYFGGTKEPKHGWGHWESQAA